MGEGSIRDVRVVSWVEDGGLIDAEGGLGDDRLDDGTHDGEEQDEQQRDAEGYDDELREPEPFFLVEWDLGRCGGSSSSSTIGRRVLRGVFRLTLRCFSPSWRGRVGWSCVSRRVCVPPSITHL